MITVYTKPACVQCNATYKALDKQGLTYEIVDIPADLRAAVALGGLGALEPVEARYFVKFHDAEKRLLDGRQHYLLRMIR